MHTEEALIPTFTPAVIESEDAEYPPAPPFPGRSTRGEIILPRWIYIKDKQGLYLTQRSSPQNATITFQSQIPNLDNAFETTRTSANSYPLLAQNGRSIVRYAGDPGWYSADGPSGHRPPFNVISANGNKVYLKDAYSPALFFSNELLPNGAPIGHNYINETSEMEIIQAAIKNEIIDVAYDINGAKVREAAPIIALSTSVRNDSDGDVNQALTYTFEKWSVGTWNNTVGVEIGAKTTFKAGVPFVATAEFEISVSASYSHEWGGEEGTKQIVTSSTTVIVPPKKKARASIIVRNAQIDVGFTYTQRVLWSNGENQDFKETGVYNNVDSWHVDVVLDNWESV